MLTACGFLLPFFCFGIRTSAVRKSCANLHNTAAKGTGRAVFKFITFAAYRKAAVKLLVRNQTYTSHICHLLYHLFYFLRRYNRFKTAAFAFWFCIAVHIDYFSIVTTTTLIAGSFTVSLLSAAVTANGLDTTVFGLSKVL